MPTVKTPPQSEPIEEPSPPVALYELAASSPSWVSGPATLVPVAPQAMDYPFGLASARETPPPDERLVGSRTSPPAATPRGIPQVGASFHLAPGGLKKGCVLMKNRYEFVLWYCRGCGKILKDGSTPGAHSCWGSMGDEWEKLFRKITLYPAPPTRRRLMTSEPIEGAPAVVQAEEPFIP